MDAEFRTRQCFEYVAYATERLKAAGFALKYTSMKSEACYYEHPAMKGRMIRVAMHPYRRRESVHLPHDLGIVAGAITFSPTAPVEKCWEKVNWKIYYEVGRYFLGDIRAKVKKYLPKPETQHIN